MAFTVYTGKGMTLTADAHNQTGLTKISVEEQAKPAVERLDKTTASSAAYEFMDDPMGPKGDPHVTLVQTAYDSTIGHTAAESQLHHFVMGGSVQLIFGVQGNGGDNEYTHTLRLQKRVTTIPHDALATVEGTWEALTIVDWGTV